MCNTHIGKHIREYREASGMSQLELSLEVGIEQSNISHYECGVRLSNIETLAKIADIFGLKLWAFFKELDI